jgi:hypothetical protein
LPGEAGRIPEREPLLADVALGPFRIDRLPYPNDPAKPPLTGLTRDEAARRCGAEGGRLCTELEWERACRGPKSDAYSTGSSWNPDCSKDLTRCASGFDVLGLGAILEWTASEIVPPGDGPRPAAVRGGRPEAPALEHRCARREPLPAGTGHAEVGFRCCKGPPNAALVSEPREGQTFEKTRLPVDELQALLAGDPRTESVAKSVIYFREPDAANTVVARGPGDRKGFLFTVAPLLWNPAAGVRFLVVSARSGDDTSFVAVFHVIGEGRYQLASSFVMRKEVGPVALAYNGYIRPRLHFSTCWGCPGETGKILYRDPDGAVILQP